MRIKADGPGRPLADGHHDSHTVCSSLGTQGAGANTKPITESQREWQMPEPVKHKGESAWIQVDAKTLGQALEITRTGRTPAVRATYINNGVGLAVQPHSMLEVVNIGSGTVAAYDVSVLGSGGTIWAYPTARYMDDGTLCPETAPEPPMMGCDPRAILLHNRCADALITLMRGLHNDSLCTLTLHESRQLEIEVATMGVVTTQIMDRPLPSWRFHALMESADTNRVSVETGALCTALATAREQAERRHWARYRGQAKMSAGVRITIDAEGIALGRHSTKDEREFPNKPPNADSHSPINAHHGSGPHLDGVTHEILGDIIEETARHSDASWTVRYRGKEGTMRFRNGRLTIVARATK